MNVDPPLLRSGSLQFVLSKLRERHDAYLVGGCVRDAVIGMPVSDIDIATDATPNEVEALFGETRVALHATGVDHGTWTVVDRGNSYEITTFRKDVATDGRRATVAFSDNIFEDAQRRDFTMNALYMDYQGVVLDPTGEGLRDLQVRKLRFVGDAQERCKEDYLRILRLFRFHAKYGKGPMDADAFWAATVCAQGMEQVSGERIWAELKKLLSTHDPCDALVEMERAGVLQRILPQHGTTGNVADVVAVERLASMAPGWERRYVALMGYDSGDIPFPHAKGERRATNTLAQHWRRGMVAAHAAFVTEDRARAYDCAVLARASGRWGWDDTVHDSVDRGMAAALPVTAQDFMDLGVVPGPALGAYMRKSFKVFLSSDLLATRDQVLNAVLERHPV